jgi:HEAT repeat protein
MLLALGTMGLAACEADPYRPRSDSLLDYLRGPSPTLAAEMATDPYDADRRYRGTILLAGASFAGEDVYMRLFRSYTTDKDSAVRGAAARAVANHGTPEDASYLIALLDDEDVIVRREAARGLQRLHNPASIEPLISTLSMNSGLESGAAPEDDTQVRAEAALALGQYASTAVIEALIASLDDPQLAVNRNSLSALRTLTGQDLGYSRTAWTLWVREQRAPLLGQAVFIYPGYQRQLKWYEHLPFVSKPHLESSGIPAGFPLPGST